MHRPLFKRQCSALIIASGALALLGGSLAKAETLQDAIRAAYQSNPTLLSQRFQQRIYDEQYVQAGAGMDPTVSVSANGIHASNTAPGTANFLGSAGPNRSISSNTASAVLDLQQPLYNGGQTSAATRAARAQVMAGRANLDNVEGQVVLQVIQAYMGVLRYQSRVKVSEDNLKALQDEYAESRAKLAAHQSTLTDLAQSEGRMHGAEAQLNNERAQLGIARSQFAEIVGHAPGEVAPPPGLKDVPADITQAYDLAEASNPALIQARYIEEVSRSRVEQAKGALRPVVSADLQAGFGSDTQYFGCCTYPNEGNYTASVSLKIPLYSRSLSSTVREQIAQNGMDRMTIEVQRRTVLQAVAQAWNELNAARANLSVYDSQVDSFRRTYIGMGKEEMYGLRSHFETLEAEQDLANAELTVLDARYSEFVAQANLLFAIGALTEDSFDASIPLYKSDRYLRKVDSTPKPPWTDPLIGMDGLIRNRKQSVGFSELDQGGQAGAPPLSAPPPPSVQDAPLPPIRSTRMAPPASAPTP